MWGAESKQRWDRQVIELMDEHKLKQEGERELLKLLEPWLVKKHLQRVVTIDGAGQRLFMTTVIGRNETKNLVGWRGDTLLHLAVRNKSSIAVIGKLLIAGADPSNTKNENGETARQVAESLNRADVLRMLDQHEVRPLSAKNLIKAKAKRRVAPDVVPRLPNDMIPVQAEQESSPPEIEQKEAAHQESRRKSSFAFNESPLKKYEATKAALERSRQQHDETRAKLLDARAALETACAERDAANLRAGKLEEEKTRLQNKLRSAMALRQAQDAEDDRGLRSEFAQLSGVAELSGARLKRLREVSEALLFRQLRPVAELASYGTLSPLLLEQAEMQALEVALSRRILESNDLKRQRAQIKDHDSTLKEASQALEASLLSNRNECSRLCSALEAKREMASATLNDKFVPVLESYATKYRELYAADEHHARQLISTAERLQRRLQNRTFLTEGAADLARAKRSLDTELAATCHSVSDGVRLFLGPIRSAAAILRSAQLYYKGNCDQALLEAPIASIECEGFKAMHKLLAAISSGGKESKVISVEIGFPSHSSRESSVVSPFHADISIACLCLGHRFRIALNLKELSDIKHRSLSQSDVALCERAGYFAPAADQVILIQSPVDLVTGIGRIRYGNRIQHCYVFGSENKRTDAKITEPVFAALRQPLCLLRKLTIHNIASLPSLASIFSRLHLNEFRLHKCSGDLGTLPSTIGNSNELEHLEIIECPLTGELPGPQLAVLTKLKTLCIRSTLLEGKIPVELGRMALNCLELSNSKLSGPIPSSLGAISALEILDLSGNELSGGIPQDLGKLKSLRRLALHENRLYGLIPTSLLSLSGFSFHCNLYDYYEIMCDRGDQQSVSRNISDTENKKKPPLDFISDTASASSQCRGCGPELACDDSAQFFCTTYGDQFGNPDTIEWSAKVQSSGFLPYFLELSFFVDARDKSRQFLMPTSIEATLEMSGKTAFIVFKRKSVQGAPGHVLRFEPTSTPSPQAARLDSHLLLRLRRPEAALGHYCGLRRVALYGTPL